MDLKYLFEPEVLENAVQILNENRIKVLDESCYSVKALVYDHYYFLVQLRFNVDHSVVYLSITKDGISEYDPFKCPYAAALMLSMALEDKYELTCSLDFNIQCELDQDNSYFASNLDQIICYHTILNDLTRHILRIQNYNTENRLPVFSQSIDNLFEYFDAIHEERPQLVAIQTFLHLYSQLTFDFENKDIHYAILDECNHRIDRIIRSLTNPFHRYYYQAILLNDTFIYPYLNDYNKTSPLSSKKAHHH